MQCDETNMHEGEAIKGLRASALVGDIASLYAFLLSLMLYSLCLQSRFVTQRKELVKDLKYAIRKENKGNRWIVSVAETLMQTINTVRPINIL